MDHLKFGFAYRAAIIGVAISAFVPCHVNAVSLDDLKPLAYDCQLIMSVKNGTPFYETHFEASVDGDSHGGGWRSFSAGSGYTVEVQADAKWIGIAWSRNKALIAKTLSVWAEGSAVHRVAFAYNPADIEEFAAVNCSRQDAY